MTSEPPLWSTNPSFDCLAREHLWVMHKEVGAFLTVNGEIPTARWCLWCGTGISNKRLSGGDDET